MFAARLPRKVPLSEHPGWSHDWGGEPAVLLGAMALGAVAGSVLPTIRRLVSIKPPDHGTFVLYAQQLTQ